MNSSTILRNWTTTQLQNEIPAEELLLCENCDDFDISAGSYSFELVVCMCVIHILDIINWVIIQSMINIYRDNQSACVCVFGKVTGKMVQDENKRERRIEWSEHINSRVFVFRVSKTKVPTREKYHAVNWIGSIFWNLT